MTPWPVGAQKGLSWDRDHDRTHILIGEAPLVGGRLLDLAQVQADDAEALLGGPDVSFITPVPSIATRSTIERARSRTFGNPAHPRERADVGRYRRRLRSVWPTPACPPKVIAAFKRRRT